MPRLAASAHALPPPPRRASRARIGADRDAARRCASPAARRPTRAWPAGATCRWPKRRCRPRRIDARADPRDVGAHRLADLTRFDAGASATPTTPRATGTTSPCAASPRQPLQLPARRPADQRRDLDPARQQGPRRHPQGHERHRRPAPARPAAWSTTSSSGRSTRRCARRFVEWRQPGTVLGARRPEPALRCRQRLRRAAQRGRRAPRPAGAQRARQPPPAGARRRLARWPATRCSRPRSRPATARSRASPASACSATRVPARADPRIT